MKAELSRFIVGRPNPIKLPIQLHKYESSAHYIAGADLNWPVKQVECFTYVENYPPLIELDCSTLSMNYSIKIGDIEGLLPHGVFLSGKYDHMRNQAIVNLQQSKWFKARKHAKQAQMKDFREQKRQVMLGIDPNKKKKKGPSGRIVPQQASSGKVFMRHF